jgi:hypothetical protein
LTALNTPCAGATLVTVILGPVSESWVHVGLLWTNGEPFLAGADTTYQLKVRWYTELEDDSRFARWLLIPNTPTHR